MTEERIIAYFLEELPEEELEQFEDECFAQESWSEQINLVEEDLIDDYLRYELTPERHERFKQKYLTTAARRERVGMAAALLRHVDETQAKPLPVSPPEPTWTERVRAFWSRQAWQLQAATALVLVALMVGVFLYWPAFMPARPPQTFATLNLNISAASRGANAPVSKVTLPPGTGGLKISLTLPEPSATAARYRVELMNERGEINTVEISGQDAQSVSVVIPAAQLPQGRYALKLYTTANGGAEQRINGSYLFAVE
ncbi:MAG: hypothetical protein QOF02_2179 [Blastocatellia bacterium]|jgi:hypothetical protein|nr:hypothetical protein [Blastocatellia bacterium]